MQNTSLIVIIKYVHKYIGVNSRLDSVQAAVLNIKLKHLNNYSNERRNAANRYDQLLQDVNQIETPKRSLNSTHVFHQYTIKVKNGERDALKKHLENFGIPAMIYYPIPLNEQEAYVNIGHVSGALSNTNYLCKSVLSLPMHTELTEAEQIHISQTIHSFFNK